MSTFAVLATGQSMNQETADFVRGKCRAVAVSDAYKLTPWAEALVSNDAKWWRCNKEALNFVGRKFAYEHVQGIEHLRSTHDYRYGINSGLQGMRVAELLGATRILLLGFDMHGTHYFGPHTAPALKNTDADRFAIHIKQFQKWKGCEVLNCTPGSALTQFTTKDIREVLHP